MIPTYMFLFIGIILALIIGGAGTMLRQYIEQRS